MPWRRVGRPPPLGITLAFCILHSYFCLSTMVGSPGNLPGPLGYQPSGTRGNVLRQIAQVFKIAKRGIDKTPPRIRV
jgi:hypothetical protein